MQGGKQSLKEIIVLQYLKEYLQTRIRLPISDEINELEGWARNPFVEVYEPKITRNIVAVEQEAEIEEQAGLTTLDGLVIETAVEWVKKPWTVNGQTFREGDLINDALIEKLKMNKLPLKLGRQVIKDVGT